MRKTNVPFGKRNAPHLAHPKLGAWHRRHVRRPSQSQQDASRWALAAHPVFRLCNTNYGQWAQAMVLAAVTFLAIYPGAVQDALRASTASAFKMRVLEASEFLASSNEPQKALRNFGTWIRDTRWPEPSDS